MVKAEMDTDFEDECKEIVQRRVTVTEKLKKIDKDSNQTANQSPSKMQVGEMRHLDDDCTNYIANFQSEFYVMRPWAIYWRIFHTYATIEFYTKKN